MKLLSVQILLLIISKNLCVFKYFKDISEKTSINIDDDVITYNQNEPRPCSTSKAKTSNICEEYSRTDIEIFELIYNPTTTILSLYKHPPKTNTKRIKKTNPTPQKKPPVKPIQVTLDYKSYED